MTGRAERTTVSMRSASRISRRTVFTIVILALLLHFSPGASARSRANNGWEAGSSSDTVSGRVGKKKSTAPKKSSGAKKSAKRCTTRACKAAPKPAPSGQDTEALKTVRLPPPQISANPSTGGLPGVTTFFWAVLPPRIDFDLSVDGISTHLAAVPLRVTWYVSDGRVLSGAPAERDEALAPVPAGGTRLEFDRPGAFQVRAVVDWDVTWSASDGESGKVDGRQSSAAVGYPVGERRSVLTGGP